MNSMIIISIKIHHSKEKEKLFIKMTKFTTEKKKNKEKKIKNNVKVNKDKNSLSKEKLKFGQRKNLYKKRFPLKILPTVIQHLSMITKVGLEKIVSIQSPG